MGAKESEAIVLRSYPLGEGDRLVSFLDRQVGRVRGVARGARLPKSRFGSTLELLSHVRIWYFEKENKDLVRINQCELIDSFLSVQADYQASIALALISEITEVSLEEREPADARFRLLLLTAKAIRDSGASPVIIAYFSLWTVRLAGWLGSLNRCSSCGRSIGNEPLFSSLNSGELFCQNCKQNWMKATSKEAVSIGSKALSGTLEQLLNSNPAGPAALEILDFSLDIIERHVDKKLVSRKMLVPGEI